MPDTQTPGPRRKMRAGMVVAGLLLVLVIVIFVARNLQHAEEMEEEEGAAPTEQTN